MFNPQARWDRPLPQADTLPGEPIEVIVSFKDGRFLPLEFSFNDEQHLIKKIEFVWKENKGREIFYLFSITDTFKNRYTICFHRQSLNWRLIPQD